MLPLTPLLHTPLCVSLIYLALIYTMFLSLTLTPLTRLPLAEELLRAGSGAELVDMLRKSSSNVSSGSGKELLDLFLSDESMHGTFAAQLIRAMRSGGGRSAYSEPVVGCIDQLKLQSVLSDLNSLTSLSDTDSPAIFL